VPPVRAALEIGDAADLATAYAAIQSVSIDYAVMQPAAAEGQVAMTAMNVGWSDVGTWTALLDALVGGYVAPARVVPPGEEARLADGDLAVVRDAGNFLWLAWGPMDLASAQPMGLLPDARPHGAAIEALLMRVNDLVERPLEARA
jgi:mannose-1-phosphate guanylyltransferase